MRLETILKRLESILQERDGRKARAKLLDLMEEIRTRLETEKKGKEEGKLIQHLMGWYLSLWKEHPPEMDRFLHYKDIIGKHLRELITIYQRNGESIDDLKKDYENFQKAWRRGDRGILHFRNALSHLKQQQGKPEWVDEEYRLNKNFWDDNDKLPWEE